MIYLDNAATTQIDYRVLDTMMPYLTTEYGNAGSVHQMGRKAATAIGTARGQVADLIGAEPDQIIFTSGGSEANNLAIKGLAKYNRNIDRDRMLISTVEHESIVEAAESLRVQFPTYTYYPDEGSGFLVDFLKSHTRIGLVSTMWVNNETGTIYPISDIAQVCHDNGVLFHADCVQAMAMFNEDRTCEWLGSDMISLSSHKIHGPKGCGALYCKNPRILEALISGSSSQEFGKRGGTEAVANIVGFGKACELLREEPELEYIRGLSENFISVLDEALNQYGLQDLVRYNFVTDHCDKILNITFHGIDSETLVLFADSKGVCISSGSACTAHEQKPSHVLMAMGLSEEEARSSIRVSFSRMNTVKEVKDAAEIIAECVKFLSTPQ